MRNLSGERVYDNGIGRSVWALTNVAYASGLWLVTAASIVAAAPGSVALFALVRGWIDNDVDVSAVSFLREVKKSFWRANSLAALVAGSAAAVVVIAVGVSGPLIVTVIVHSALLFGAWTVAATAAFALPSLAEERSLLAGIRVGYRRAAQSPMWASFALASVVSGYATMAYVPVSVALPVWLTAPVVATLAVTLSFRRAAGVTPFCRGGASAGITIGSADRSIPTPNPGSGRSSTKRENP